MNRLLSVTTLATSLLVLLADSQKISGQPENAEPSPKPYTPNAVQQNTWEHLQQDHPGKNEITWNSSSRGPKKITGSNLYLENRAIDRSNVVDEARKFLRNYERLFNIPGTDIIRGRVAQEHSGKFLVQFEQAYRAVPIQGSYARFKIKPNGQIESIECKFYSYRNINTSPTPGVVLGRAIHSSINELSLSDSAKGSIRRRKDRRKWEELYLIEEQEVFSLCWKFDLLSPGFTKRILVDAHTGKVLSVSDVKP